ncbi:MAG: GAF domain-containing protein [Leptolyngbyaceae cyanobacterium bins.59]|nr:GAF domain-containing protein [Leptolyngbyaceae cyanobacterium bins.59]
MQSIVLEIRQALDVDRVVIYQSGKEDGTSAKLIAEAYGEMGNQLPPKANLIVPIYASVSPVAIDGLWGLLALQHFSSPQAWTATHQQCCGQVAQLLAMAVQRASLQKQLQQEQQAHQQTQRELQLLETIIQAVQDATNFEAALQLTLHHLCTLTGWVYGEAWLPDTKHQLNLGPVWHRGESALLTFEQLSREMTMEPGMGLAGRVYLRKQPEWNRDVSELSQQVFGRVCAAQKSGLKAALGVPLVVDGEVLAVVVLFSATNQPEEPHFIELASTVALQVGSAIQRKRTEEALRLEEARWRSVSENAVDIIVLLDQNGFFRYVSPSSRQVLGYAPEAVVGCHAFEFVPEEDGPLIAQTIQNAIQQPGISQPLVLYRVRHADGSLRIFEATTTSLLHNPAVEAIVVNCHDITARAQAEQERDQLLQQLAEHNQHLENLVAQRTGDLHTIVQGLNRANQQLQAEIAERQRTEAALRQQVDRERLTMAIAHRIRVSLDLMTILNTTVQDVQDLLKSDRVLVYQILPDSSGKVIAEAVMPGYDSVLSRAFSTEVFPVACHDAYIQGKYYALHDRDREPVSPCLVQFMKQMDVRAKLVVPIVQQESLWGLLIVHQCSQPREWLPWEIVLMQQLATQLGIAIQQSELYYQLQDELQQRELALREQKRAEISLKASLDEKEMLLKEIHHRVKNNLQVISSIFSLQSRYVTDPQVLSLLSDSKNRIHSMALIHEKLYQSNTLARIDFADYVRNLVSTLFSSYNMSPNLIRLTLQVAEVPLNLDTAIPCGLLINELVSNSLKHGFPNNRTGEIRVRLQAEDNELLRLQVEDDGVGFPPDMHWQNNKSLGLRLIQALTRQLRGTLQIKTEQGTSFQVLFPRPEMPQSLSGPVLPKI